MINLSVDSHGNHPGSRQKERGGATKRVKVTPKKYTKMTAHRGIFVLSKRGLCLVQ